MIFELSEYTNERYVMHCDTKEKAIIFTTYLHNHGKQWIDRVCYIDNDRWDMHKSDMCYQFNVGKESELQFYKSHGFMILEFDHYDWGVYTGEDIDGHAFDDILETM